MSCSAKDINVSLEQHLVEKLRLLEPLLPPELSACVQPYLLDSTPRTIPYHVLFQISQWVRQSEGLAALETAKLEIHGYSMISLLAGTTTSPERNFPPAPPPRDAAEVAAQQKFERKAITALVNSLLSIAGSGFAAWWASDKIGWKDEWRALLSLCVAFLVAASEGILFLIWQSRASNATSAGKSKRRHDFALRKKDGPNSSSSQEAPSVDLVSSKEERAKLRKRTGNVK